jgi:prepilin-type N-terminal cleavage/methylation domain-containing protein/prepilin-type processing-associated H-X9-DG protein
MYCRATIADWPMRRNHGGGRRGGISVPTVVDRVRRATGFTLIELLIVVAILSLLVSILLPAISKAKALAKSAVCLSNLRQIGTAEELYASENNGYQPPVNNADRTAYWDAILWFYLGGSPSRTHLTGLVLNEGLQPLGLYQCPADMGHEPGVIGFSANRQKAWLSYVVNLGHGMNFAKPPEAPNHWKANPPRRFENLVDADDDRLRSPSDYVNLLDQHWWRYQSDGSAYNYASQYSFPAGYQGYWSYHSDGRVSNCLFWDGHAEPQARETDLSADSLKVNFWLTGPYVW